MIINDKYLNSKPTYNIPEGVEVATYTDSKDIKRLSIPAFTPDICINGWGTIGVRGYKDTATQICVKSNDSNLISYLKEYDWCGVFNMGSSIVGAGKCNKWQVEKIISEYYSSIK